MPPLLEFGGRELAAHLAKEKALRETIEAALPQVRRLFAAFIDRMRTVPKIPIADASNGLMTVKHWRYAPEVRYRGKPVGSGWFVVTRHEGLDVSSPSSRGSYIELRAPLGVAVADSGAVFPSNPRVASSWRPSART